MKIDSTRYRMFLSNPEEYRIREVWNLVPTGGNKESVYTFGRRRGSAFHDLHDGASLEDVQKHGEKAVQVAQEMIEANERDYGNSTKVLWTEKEFDIPIPDSPHRMVGKIDSLVERYDERFILDFKTTKHRTKEGMQQYRDELQQSPQADFYLCAVPEVRKLVYRILWRQPKKGGPVVRTSELDVTRQKWELAAFQRGVHMVCETIEMWRRDFGVEKPWPRALKVMGPPEFYGYAPIYQRSIYPGAEYEGFTRREEHLAVLREGANASH